MTAENRADVDRDIEATLGLAPEFFGRVPDYLLPTEFLGRLRPGARATRQPPAGVWRRAHRVEREAGSGHQGGQRDRRLLQRCVRAPGRPRSTRGVIAQLDGTGPDVVLVSG